MSMQLVVVRAFGPYGKGDVIGDTAAVSKVLTGEHAHAVVRVGAGTTAAPVRRAGGAAGERMEG